MLFGDQTKANDQQAKSRRSNALAVICSEATLEQLVRLTYPLHKTLETGKLALNRTIMNSKQQSIAQHCNRPC
jgi:hypothetical protein